MRLDEEGVIAADVVPLRAGLHGQPLALDPEPAGVVELLRGLGSSPLVPAADRAALAPSAD